MASSEVLKLIQGRLIDKVELTKYGSIIITTHDNISICIEPNGLIIKER